jgi:polygalacturonase
MKEAILHGNLSVVEVPGLRLICRTFRVARSLRQLLIPGMLLGLFLSRMQPVAAAGIHDVRDYGAKGDGVSKDTAAVQAAIAAVEQQGGGEVLFPPGHYLCGTLHLKSNLTLRLLSGAVLLASPDAADFAPYENLSYDPHSDRETGDFHFGLLTGENIHDVAIEGAGIIDGNRSKRGGPKPIALKNCQHILIRDITLQNAPNYNISFLGCDYVVVDGVTILNGYADGIDPDCSRFVRIANCSIDSHDDAICLKASLALGVRRSTENVTVTNCVLATASNHFKLGTESSGDFKNIALSNCTMLRRTTHPDADRDRAAVSIESVDGAVIDGLTVSNLVIQNVFSPLFIRLGNRGRGQNPPTPGSLENVSITNVVATGATMTCIFAGLPSHPIRHVNLDSIQVTFQGGVEASLAAPNSAVHGLDVPEAPAAYPESNMFGILPSYGFYCRHVEGLTLRNVHVRWQKPDARPALLCDDVHTLDLDGFQTETVAAAQPAVWLHQTTDALLHGCRTRAAPHFLRLSGADTTGIRLSDNDLAPNAQAIERAPEVPPSAITP